MEDINLLILLLKRIDSDCSIYVYKEEYTVSHPLVNAAKYIACQNLNKNNINKMIEAGFDVFPNTIDKCGWIKGYIQLSRGIITYSITFPRYI